MFNTENITKSFGLDSGDPGNINANHCDYSQSNLCSNATETNQNQYNSSYEKDIKTYPGDRNLRKNPFEELKSSILKSALPVSNESHQDSKFSAGEKYDTKLDEVVAARSTNAVVLKKPTTKQARKIRRQVHFNTEVETFLFEPSFSIVEDYNFKGEPTVENVFNNCNNGRHLSQRIRRGFWKSEGNLPGSALYDPVPTLEEFVSYHRYLRNLRREPFCKSKYTRINYEEIANIKRQIDFQRLKRSNSLFIRQEKDENENGPASVGTGSIFRRFSMSVQNLKNDVKALIDKLVNKMMKRKEEEPLTTADLQRLRSKDNASAASKEEKGRPKLKRWKSLYFRNENCVIENGSVSASGTVVQALSMSTKNQKDDSKSFRNVLLKKVVKRKEEPFTIADIQRIHSKDYASSACKIEKGRSKLKRWKSFYVRNENCATENGFASASGTVGKTSMSTENLKDGAKSFKNAFL